MLRTKMVFPEYNQVVRANNTKKYSGWSFRIHLCHSLYASVECLNESAVFPGQSGHDDYIRFSWCTEKGFPIAVTRQPNTEEGYRNGLSFLICTAEDFRKNFHLFLNCTEPEEGEKNE